MSSFLKSIFHSSNKHKKLSEEWTNNREPVVDGVTFYVRYLGSSLVEDPKSAPSTAAGVKRIIHAAKAGARRPERVAFRVSMEGVRIDSTGTGETLMDTSIYKISYCSADSQYEQVLAFVASNEDETCECHAFLCSKRKVAEAIAVSIAQAFTMAYECWKLALEAKRNGQNTLSSDQVAGRGGESPSRSKDGGDGNCSRSSSPGHSPGYSSTPSEVSSTSGYQSSTTGGLLLELDDTDAGSEGALAITDTQQQASSGGRARKHWTSFDDVSELADDFGRLTSDPPKSSCPWVHCTAPTAAASCGSSPLEWPGGKRPPLLLPPTAPVEEGAAGSPAPPVAIAPSTAASASAAATQCPTLSSSCLRQSTRTQPLLTSDFTSSSEEFSRMDRSSNTNPINQPDATFTNQTNTTKFLSRPESITNKFSSLSKMQNFHNSSKQNLLNQFGSCFSNGVASAGSLVSNGADIRTWQHEVDSAFRLNSGGILVPRVKWESFDSGSPPNSPTSPNPCVSSSISSLPRSQSPISAFLDSCLTPRPDEDEKESKFAFLGRLSGEGHIFTPNNSSVAVFADIKEDFGISKQSNSSHPVMNGVLKELTHGKMDGFSCSGSNLPVRSEGPFSNSSVDPFSPRQRQLPPEAVR